MKFNKSIISAVALALLSSFLFFSPSCGENEAKLFQILKSKNEKIGFIAIGDAGVHKDTQLRVASAVGSWCARTDKQCDFGLYLGDNFYESGLPDDQVEAESLWLERFALPYAHLTFPFYVAMGNHDYSFHGRGRPDWQKVENYQRFHNKSAPSDRFSGKWQFPSAFYNFSAGNAMFMALDTQQLLYGRNVDLQQKLFESSYEAALDQGLRFRVMFGHHPIYSNGSHGNAGDYGYGTALGKIKEQKDGSYIKRFYQSKSFGEQSLCQHVDLFISGHDHNLQLINRNQEQCPGLYIVSGVGGKVSKLYRTAAEEVEAETLWQKSSLGFSYIEIEGDKISINMVNERAKDMMQVECRLSPKHREKFSCRALKISEPAEIY